ncbi:hypothetical protein Pmar_PMAR001169 [Perkinsus marinus ATCC 50983]|uniref:Uncharacterized protein n=1 Tax=Perkinsus marinus (strain ATCC 50983 / TXsc) TaxID=423536 RepID=C5KT20_PERM5|nr:hypothetical protein Pmar_PMAR001169 [Perkinsus marinus ATCC 50983]EER12370.1 hypothetical protein Pmar_PMAR001169 [Perkinsus marinus ATCC 50983]|eukprot:XP_002780575.1 hypothetical protein Pmar_PMAR001169 [Perkinsus marinus ATCC 50983]
MTDEKPQSHLDVVSTAVDHIEAAAGKANTAQSSNGVASAHPEDDAANAITTPIESPLSEESCDTPVKESDNDDSPCESGAPSPAASSVEENERMAEAIHDDMPEDPLDVGSG